MSGNRRCAARCSCPTPVGSARMGTATTWSQWTLTRRPTGAPVRSGGHLRPAVRSSGDSQINDSRLPRRQHPARDSTATEPTLQRPLPTPGPGVALAATEDQPDVVIRKIGRPPMSDNPGGGGGPGRLRRSPSHLGCRPRWRCCQVVKSRDRPRGFSAAPRSPPCLASHSEPVVAFFVGAELVAIPLILLVRRHRTSSPADPGVGPLCVPGRRLPSLPEWLRRCSSSAAWCSASARLPRPAATHRGGRTPDYFGWPELGSRISAPF
jgi:hypothetical protein